MTHTFKIHAASTTMKSSVELDGKRLEGVKRVYFDLAAGQKGQAVIHLEIIGEAIVDGQYEDEAMLVMKQGVL